MFVRLSTLLLLLIALVVAPSTTLLVSASRSALDTAIPASPVDKRASKLQPRQNAPVSSRGMGRRKLARSLQEKAERAKKDYSAFLCPGGSNACPNPATRRDPATGVERPMTPAEMQGSLSSLADWFKVGFECVEFETEENACGGCVTLGRGADCSAIPFARRAGCERSQCVVYQCKEGYTISGDKQSCVRRSGALRQSSGYGLDDDDDGQLSWS